MLRREFLPCTTRQVLGSVRSECRSWLFILAAVVAADRARHQRRGGQTVRRRAGSTGGAARVTFATESLDGSGNNASIRPGARPGTNYMRVASANYTDGIAKMVAGPNARYISNRIFNDIGQNLFSENNISQWAWAWGQFIDHDMGLRDETPAEDASVPFNASDPLESFANDTGSIAFNRTPAAPGTGISSTRQQVNTLSSYHRRVERVRRHRRALDWLRNGPSTATRRTTARLCCCPTTTSRASTPAATRRLRRRWISSAGSSAAPTDTVVAGDVRANENLALTAIQTLFAREHNRIVAELPKSLSPQSKFQIARRVVGAEVRVHHVHPVPSRARREARAVPRVQPARERRHHRRVRHRRLPRALHGARRVRRQLLRRAVLAPRS